MKKLTTFLVGITLAGTTAIAESEEMKIKEMPKPGAASSFVRSAPNAKKPMPTFKPNAMPKGPTSSFVRSTPDANKRKPRNMPRNMPR